MPVSAARLRAPAAIWLGPDALQARAQLLSDTAGIARIADHLRSNEHDKLGSLGGSFSVAQEIAEDGNLRDTRQAVFVGIALFADETTERHHLPAVDRNGAGDAPLRYGGRQGLGALGG